MKNQNLFFGLGAAAALLLILKKITSSGLRIKDVSNSLPTNGRWQTRPAGGITDITLHHTASGPDWTPERLANLHINQRRWPGIAYHFLIYESGEVLQTNPIESRTYHNGYNNTVAIGISMVGNYELTKPTDKQVKATVNLIRKLKKQHPSIYRLVGHGEYPGASTACPGANNNMSYYMEQTGLKGYAKAVPFAFLPGNYLVDYDSPYNPNFADN